MKRISLLVLGLSLILALSACGTHFNSTAGNDAPTSNISESSTDTSSKSDNSIFSMLTKRDAIGTAGENIDWYFKDGVLTFKGTGDMKDFGMEVRYPFNIENYTGPWVYQDGTPFIFDIETVIIEDGITSIGGYAFRNCENLTSVSIPETVTSIGNEAFNYCESLTEVTIPSSVTSTGLHPFFGCDNLEKMTILCEATDDIDSLIFLAYWGNDVREKLVYYSGYSFERWIERTPTSVYNIKWIKID